MKIYISKNILRYSSLFLNAAKKINPLYHKIRALTPQLLAAAQKVYDEWEQDEEGMDPELGFGGICQDIADAMASVLNQTLPDYNFTIMDNNGIGEQHVWVVIWDDSECYAVDIPPGVYETGSGYTWHKIPDVTFTEDDLIIEDSPTPEEDY